MLVYIRNIYIHMHLYNIIFNSTINDISRQLQFYGFHGGTKCEWEKKKFSDYVSCRDN